MPRRQNGQPPPYCKHRQSSRAYVRFNGRQIMLGEYGTPASRARYSRLLLEWDANGQRLPETVW
jgi:hypothetical protein